MALSSYSAIKDLLGDKLKISKEDEEELITAIEQEYPDQNKKNKKQEEKNQDKKNKPKNKNFKLIMSLINNSIEILKKHKNSSLNLDS